MALALEDNPPELFIPESVAQAGAGSESQDAGASKIFGPCPWAVAQTGHQKEKTVARTLMAMSIPYFLPMEAIRYTGNRSTVFRVIFEGTIFFRADPDPVSHDYILNPTNTEATVRRLSNVYGILRVGHQVRLKQEMSIWAFEPPEHRTIRSLLPEEAVPDKKVEAIDGPFKGFEGRIDSAIGPGSSGKAILYVNMMFMGGLRRVEVPTNWLIAI